MSLPKTISYQHEVHHSSSTSEESPFYVFLLTNQSGSLGAKPLRTINSTQLASTLQIGGNILQILCGHITSSDKELYKGEEMGEAH